MSGFLQCLSVEMDTFHFFSMVFKNVKGVKHFFFYMFVNFGVTKFVFQREHNKRNLIICKGLVFLKK